MLSIPEALRAALARADEEYLTGLCNKGTVNRGKKDLAGLTPEAQVQGETVVVTAGEVQCTLRAPLGDSGCSCPAQGMCRHRVTAILWLKGQLDEAESAPPAADLSELLEVPAVHLRRAMGSKAFHALVFRLGREGLPPMEEGSTVRVELPWEGAVVKLLLPLEYASCTCRSRELCSHKAAALLCWQVKKGRHTLEELAAQFPQESTRWDLEQVSAAAQAVEELTAGLLEAGLSRLSPAAPDSAERLAALCHTAALPRLESGLRILSTLLRRALERSAAFRTEDLLLRLAGLDHLARRLKGERNPARLPELAGTFREEYRPCPPLTLHLLGERRFHADGGYAGTVYYLWEVGQRQWYTYTAARPTFYEGRAQKRPSARDPAPWGLDCLMDQLYGCTITLEGGKVSKDRRLSASEESRAAAGGKVQPWEALPPELCWEDFSALFRAVEPFLLEGAETDRLVLVRPSACAAREFDGTRQLFRMELLDGEGRVLLLEARYWAEEKELIQVLERLARRLEEEPERVPAFLGLVRLEGEGLSLYPIEYWFDWGCGR